MFVSVLQAASLAESMEAPLHAFGQRKHVTVLAHVMGSSKHSSSPDGKRQLVEVLKTSRRKLLPLIASVIVFNHCLRSFWGL
jgi:uncharacterized protein YbgA (DUF1722 family)